MKIQSNTVVTLRYKMFNSKGEVLENLMDGPPIAYVHGAGKVVPLLETSLLGLEVGERKMIALKVDDDRSLDDDFNIEVLIDGVRLAIEEEIRTGYVKKQAVITTCGDNCICI